MIKNQKKKCLLKNPWLAGLIDGDGYFYTKNGYCGLEITLASHESPLLAVIKQSYGGSIKNRCNSKSVRYRLHNKPGLTDLVHAINGHIRNSIRVNQLKAVLVAYQIDFIPPSLFSYKDGYACGLFDSDGTITLSVKRSTCAPNITGVKGKIARLETACETQLSISVTQKYKHNVIFLIGAIATPINSVTGIPYDLKQYFCERKSDCKIINPFGSIYYDKSQNGYYKWYITSRKHIYAYLHYNWHFPSMNPAKSHRLRLVPVYYALWDLKAHKSEVNSDLNKQWVAFVQAWFKYDGS